MTNTEGKTLEAVVALLGASYKQWKDHEKAKNGYKTEFFALADQSITDKGLALRFGDYVGASEQIASERARRHNPGWRIDTIRPHRVKHDTYEVVLVEDPKLMAFAVEHEGVKYARQISRGAVLVDDEWLQEEDHELYEAVTFELPWGERIMTPVEHLDKALLGRLTKYLYNGPPKVVLAPPRPVKDEE